MTAIVTRLQAAVQKLKSPPQEITLPNEDGFWNDKVEVAADTGQLVWKNMKTLGTAIADGNFILAQAPMNFVLPATFVPNVEAAYTITCDIDVAPDKFNDPARASITFRTTPLAPHVRMSGLDHSLAVTTAAGTIKPGFVLNIPAVKSYNSLMYAIKGYHTFIADLKQDNFHKMIAAVLMNDSTFTPEYPPEFNIETQYPDLLKVLKQARDAYDSLTKTTPTSVVFGTSAPAPAPAPEPPAQSAFLTDILNVNLE